MRFPNLSWALAERGFRQYRLANVLDVADSWLSRALAGRTNFTAAQRERIAEILGYPEAWLFAEVSPPPVDKHERAPVGVSPRRDKGGATNAAQAKYLGVLA